MEGYYLDSISYLNRCDTNTNGVYNVDASVYYLVNGLQNGTDNLGHAENHPNDPVAGDITQSVRESDYAWHVRCWNDYMFGTEHEGFVSTPAWYSEAMYQASAGLPAASVRHLRHSQRPQPYHRPRRMAECGLDELDGHQLAADQHRPAIRTPTPANTGTGPISWPSSTAPPMRAGPTGT